jgi:hypothetical protein
MYINIYEQLPLFSYSIEMGYWSYNHGKKVIQIFALAIIIFWENINK